MELACISILFGLQFIHIIFKGVVAALIWVRIY